MDMEETKPNQSPMPQRSASPSQASLVGRPRLRGATIGATAGALAGFLLIGLGVNEIVGYGSFEPFVVAGALAGAIVGALGFAQLVIAADGLMAVVMLVIMNTPVMGPVARRWVRMDSLPAKADAIVVLSARVNSDGYLSTQGVQRLLTGLAAYKTGVAKRLLTTAVEATFGTVIRTSVADQERLIDMVGAKDAWTSMSDVSSTRDEVMQTARHLPSDARTIIVVTSPMHTRRACAAFEGVGFRVTCVPSREHDFVAWHPRNSQDRLEAFRQYAYERLGMIEYRAKGWLPKAP